MCRPSTVTKEPITKEAVSKMSYEPIRAEDMIHNLFGGVESKQKHHLYKVYANSFQKDYHCSFEAYDQEKICIDIPTAISGPWTKEIEQRGIFLSDKEACLDDSVHLLIGADIAGATLNHLLDGAPDCYKMTAQHLQKSMYVDNCVAIVKSEADLTKFINESREIMALGKFELRGWQHNSFESLRDNCNESQNASPILQDIPVLGLLWNIERDTLKIDVRNDTQSESVKVTKRYILSKCHKIFDPIGITAPITLIPKILLQETWKIKANWDDILPEEIAHKFEKWDRQLHQLNKLEIPRWIQGHKNSKHSLHVFCDASQQAYATCIFLRSVNQQGVTCHLVAARSRVAPLKSISISRLELLGCCIGLRLAKTICTDLEELGGIPVYYWSDSMNCLYWIKNDEQWATFVMNRVKEIRTGSESLQWNYVPGNLNPADLPSRGCSVNTLIARRWWEGPAWLTEEEELWPISNLYPDKNVVNAEKKKSVVTSLEVSKDLLKWNLELIKW
ncbi:reverse transcriptase [Caerostris darwini]|uniref:Reverse transcriptase n=1 Tax=Caerostris darwini TaxID=1538125 RepID=A0AAV4M8B5_9ARAC|nr:reverse transcriptase [Caerostris darwini]